MCRRIGRHIAGQPGHLVADDGVERKKPQGDGEARLVGVGSGGVEARSISTYFIEGIRLYAFNCAVCHGAADAKPSNIAVGLYQLEKAPQLADDGVEDDPEGVTFWKIKHGIRLDGHARFQRHPQ